MYYTLIAYDDTTGNIIGIVQRGETGVENIHAEKVQIRNTELTFAEAVPGVQTGDKVRIGDQIVEVQSGTDVLVVDNDFGAEEIEQEVRVFREKTLGEFSSAEAAAFITELEIETGNQNLAAVSLRKASSKLVNHQKYKVNLTSHELELQVETDEFEYL